MGGCPEVGGLRGCCVWGSLQREAAVDDAHFEKTWGGSCGVCSVRALCGVCVIA